MHKRPWDKDVTEKRFTSIVGTTWARVHGQPMPQDAYRRLEQIRCRGFARVDEFAAACLLELNNHPPDFQWRYELAEVLVHVVDRPLTLMSLSLADEDLS